MNLKRLRIARSLMIIAGTAALLTSCQYDDLPDRTVEHGEALQISVTTERFTADGIETRATDIGYITSFITGDTIGITVVRDGTTILEDNIPYRYDGSAWNPVANAVHLYPGTNISYLVYYPFDTNMDGKTTAADMIAAFTPRADQSIQTAYTASDLMTGVGTLNGTSLSIILTHALSLIELNFPAGVSSVSFDIDGGTRLTPYSFEDAFRYITKPQNNPVELSGSYTAGGETMHWQLPNATLSAGKYIKINVFILSVIEGYKGRVQVFYTDSSNEITSITDSGILKIVNGAGKTIMKIVLLDQGDKEYLIGRKTDQPLRLKFDTDGSLLFRSAEDGYIPIGSYAEFQKINENSATRAGYYRQEADLDLMNVAWRPVGDDTIRRVTATYDGNNKTISRLSINNASLNYAGLFGVVGVGGTIQNLNIVEANVRGGNYAGSLVGYATGANISNCHTSGEVGGRDYVGGIAGYVSTGSVVEACENNTAINGRNYIGGIVSYVASNSKVETCRNNSAINGTGRLGGIVGYVTSNSIVNACKNSGTVNGTGDMVGGIAGETLSGGVVKNSYSTGEVSGANDVGGVVGCVTRSGTTGSVERCYSTSAVRGITSVGGVAGLANSGATVSNCVALNAIVSASTSNVGRVAYLSGGNIVNSLAWDGMSNGDGISFPGGIQIAHDRMDGKSITSSQAKMQATYVNYITLPDLPAPLSWDFTNIWTINEGNGYPALQWE